ncbi:cytochrome P450 [Maricurvus nonylphenolicus]|uniref:cytochrome P450 n=1 Tax=Maricurvus nonylphenolicus TaxID=1008307 RepID=UPI0036F3EED7
MNNFVDFNLIAPDFVPDNKGPALEFFKWMRENQPVHFNDIVEGYECPMEGASMSQGFWVLSKYEDVQSASRNTKVFSSGEQGPLLWDMEPHRLAEQQAGIMGKDDPEHAALKRLVVPPFLPKNLAAYTPRIAEKVKKIVDDVASKGECEMVFDIASRLPVATFCELMGIPNEDQEKIFNLGNALADVENQDSDGAAELLELFAYCDALSAKKRENPDDSMLSLYANGEFEGEKLPQEAVNMFFVTLSIAGHETTRNTLIHFFRLMNEYPEQYELLKSDVDKYLTGAINEVLRYCPPVMQFRRTCLEDVEVRGQQLKKGDKVFLSYVSANRDADVFENPDVFDITRTNSARHLSFGTGPHTCLGARLAVTQLSLLIKEIINRIPDIRPKGEPEYLRSIWFHAIMSMPVEFTAEK